MPPGRKNSLIKSYQFKLPKDERLDWFQRLITQVAEKLLQKLWNEEWIKNLGERSSLKAYKVINEAQVQLEGIYLPSRIRRGIAEKVGRILRGQYKRMKCYYDCLEIINWLGTHILEQKLTAVVMQHCKTQGKNGKQFPRYTRVMVEQTIRMFKKWQERVDEYVVTLQYVDLVRPGVKNFSFPYTVDDKQAIKYSLEGQSISVEMKLPRIPQPKTMQDWRWVELPLLIPEKLQEKIANAVSDLPLKPTLRTKTLKGGLEYFFLQFPWEFEEKQEREVKVNERALAVDLGLKKQATCIVAEKGKQLSRPIVIRLVSSQYRHIERIYRT